MIRGRAMARRPVPLWLAVAVLALAAVLVLVPGPGRQLEAAGSRLLAPLQLAVSQVIGQVLGGVELIQRAGQLREQNRIYREEVDRLQAEMVRLRELELENYDLRNLLGLRQQAPPGEMIAVRVLARDPLPFVQAVTVDGGADQGLREDLPVLTWRGLVGRIVEVQPTTARVLLVTDANSSVSGRVQNPESRATGILRGRNDDWLLMQYIGQQEVVQTGDLVITSGLGGVFPEGMPLGKIVQVRRRAQDLFQEALVEPAARLGHLERLYVLTSNGGEGR
ncbi:MAG TPA: rod shape-determining protein MreC [Chloroflexota bacterium]|nr:rod shape-determining protein MreC [Chloroflexota bacterium]